MTAGARGDTFRASVTTTIKPITRQEVIKWLKRKPKATTFTWVNQGCGCLFTRYLRHKTGNRKLVVGIGGIVSLAPNRRDIPGGVPFHDRFWDVAQDVAHSLEVDRDTAIKILTDLNDEN